MANTCLNLYQLSDGYCYNTDSLILAYFARGFLKPKTRLLDIGAGCGILGLLCAREQTLELQMLEIDPKASLLARRNAANTSFAKNALVHNMSIFDFKSSVLFDTIITNPPFYNPHILKSPNDRKNLARIQDSMPLAALLASVKRLLKPRGNLLLCYDARECTVLFYELRKAGLYIQNACFVYPLRDRDASLVLIQAKIDYKGMLRILPPIYTHNSPNQQDNTEQLRQIYAWAHTHSIKVQSIDI